MLIYSEFLFVLLKSLDLIKVFRTYSQFGSNRPYSRPPWKSTLYKYKGLEIAALPFYIQADSAVQNATQSSWYFGQIEADVLSIPHSFVCEEQINVTKQQRTYVCLAGVSMQI